MEEGQLFKMLVEKGESQWKRFAYEQVGKGRRFGEFTQKDFIQKVLDEAKKEFPCLSCLAFKSRSCEGPQYHCPSIKHRDWFLKWLGGE